MWYSARGDVRRVQDEFTLQGRQLVPSEHRMLGPPELHNGHRSMTKTEVPDAM